MASPNSSAAIGEGSVSQADDQQLLRLNPFLREIDQLCQLSLLLLGATGFFALAGTGKLDLFSVILVSSALVVRGTGLLRRWDWRIPERWTTYLGLLYVLAYGVDLLLVSRGFVAATIHLLLFGLVIKLFSVERYRDLLYLAILAFMEILAAAMLTVGSGFLTSFALFVLVAIGSFICLEIRRSAAVSARTGLSDITPGPHFRALYHALLGITIAQAAGIALLATLIFFVLPRLSSGYLSQLAQQNDLMTGFGDRVSLGQIGRIQQSSAVMMHVKFDGLRPSEVRLRGATLTNFDGQNWMATPHAAIPGVRVSQTFQFPMPSSTATSGLRNFAVGRSARLVQYRVILEPLGSNVLFVIPTPRALFGNMRQVYENFDQSVESLDRDRMLANYSGVSDISSPYPDDLKKVRGEIPPGMPERYLELPQNLDPRIAKLADENTRQQHSVYEKAAALERYLTNNFGYTLELPSQPHADPIAYFLFERKRGHCEYFASSMAVMLRAIGIPSRIITGFRGGEFNDLTGSYIIRARDAHAWVEAYIPNRGWLAFDPTPAGDELPTRWSKLQLYLDAASEFWRDWVVNYDFSHQRMLTVSTMTHSRRAGDRLRQMLAGVYPRMLGLARRLIHSVERHPRPYQAAGLTALALLICLVLGGPFTRWLKRRVLAAQPTRSPKHAATVLYEKMTRTTRRHGWPREPNQTPEEFAGIIGHAGLRAAVEKFTAHYERARYADSASDAALLPELLRQVQAATRQGR
jgi:transglutaminase-like putative cysteine protease